MSIGKVVRAMRAQGMNSLTERNTKSLAEYLYRVAGCPTGKANEHWESAEKQLEQNLFDETGPLAWVTPEQIAARARHGLSKQEDAAS